LITVDPSRPKGIVWLASYPKSGNTWIRVFLYALYNLVLGSPLTEIDLNRMADFGANDRATVYYERYLHKPPTAADRAAIANARLKVQADIVAATPGIVLVKTHNALIEDAGMPTINRGVSAGAIYVLRNPLDVAISFAHFRSIPIDAAIDIMATDGFATEPNSDDVHFITGSWSQHVQSWTERPHPAVHVVRYEDMLERPAEAFGAIARHAMLPAGHGLLEKAIDLASFQRLQKAEDVQGFLEKPPNVDRFFRVGRAGQWREVLTSAQVQRIVDAHGPAMARFGYL
jgi:hypothetical protein